MIENISSLGINWVVMLPFIVPPNQQDTSFDPTQKLKLQ